MKRKLVGILVIMLMIATTFSVAVTANNYGNTPPHGLYIATTIGTRFSPAPIGSEAEIKVLARDDENNSIYFMIDWDDGTPLEWDGPYTQATHNLIQHIYTEIPEGNDYYTVQMWAKDEHDAESTESPTTKIYVEDIPEAGQPQISGPDEGSIGIPIPFDVFVPDDEGPRTIGIEWEINGESSGPKGAYKSATNITPSYTFPDLGEMEIRIKSWIKMGANVYVKPSEWSEPTITINITNEAPDVPTITGPTDCIVGIEYTYKVQTTDPDGQDVKYKIDWDDGTSEWTEYHESGQELNVTKIWTKTGEFDVTVMASDSWEQTEYSDPLTVTVGALELDVEVIGLIGVTAIVENIGTGDATDVEAILHVTGGIAGKIDETDEYSGDIGAGEEITLSASPIIGFGAIDITVNVTGPGFEPIAKHYQAVVLFFIVVALKEV